MRPSSKCWICFSPSPLMSKASRDTKWRNGKIYPVLQVHISPEVSGEIIELPVKEGQFVHKGDLLLKINPDVYNAGLNQAKAGYESSLAAKTTATANLEKAEADYVRNKSLFDTKLLSDSDFIGFKVAKDVAQAQVESCHRPGQRRQGGSGQRAGFAEQDHHRRAARRHDHHAEFATRRARARHGAKRGHGHHDHFRFERRWRRAWTSAKWTSCWCRPGRRRSWKWIRSRKKICRRRHRRSPIRRKD